jgi:hypothetical protein
MTVRVDLLRLAAMIMDMRRAVGMTALVIVRLAFDPDFA